MLSIPTAHDTYQDTDNIARSDLEDLIHKKQAVVEMETTRMMKPREKLVTRESILL